MIIKSNSDTGQSYWCVEPCVRFSDRSVEYFFFNHPDRRKKSSFEKNAFKVWKKNFHWKFILTLIIYSWRVRPQLIKLWKYEKKKINFLKIGHETTPLKSYSLISFSFWQKINDIYIWKKYKPIPIIINHQKWSLTFQNKYWLQYKNKFNNNKFFYNQPIFPMRNETNKKTKNPHTTIEPTALQ